MPLPDWPRVPLSTGLTVALLSLIATTGSLGFVVDTQVDLGLVSSDVEASVDTEEEAATTEGSTSDLQENTTSTNTSTEQATGSTLQTDTELQLPGSEGSLEANLSTEVNLSTDQVTADASVGTGTDGTVANASELRTSLGQALGGTVNATVETSTVPPIPSDLETEAGAEGQAQGPPYLDEVRAADSVVQRHRAPLGTPVHVDTGLSAGAAADQGDGQEAEEGTARLSEGRGAVLPVTATVAGAVGYWLLRMRHLGILGFAPLYSKLTREELLDNPARQRVLDLVRERPGLCVKEIMSQIGHAWGATIYHLNRLEDAGFLFHRHQGRHRRYYAVGEQADEDLEALGLLREATPGQVAAHLLEHPGAMQKEVAEHLGVAPPTVHKHTERLVETGLVTKVREGRSVHYHPTPRLARLDAEIADKSPGTPLPT